MPLHSHLNALKNNKDERHNQRTIEIGHHLPFGSNGRRSRGDLNAVTPQTYQGKTVCQWVSLLDSNVDYQKQREEAAWALVQIGTNTLLDLERIRTRLSVWS